MSEQLEFRQVAKLSRKEWRGYRKETCRLLLKEKKIRIYDDCFAFPAEDCSGCVIGAHYQLSDGSWRYTRGVKAAALTLKIKDAARYLRGLSTNSVGRLIKRGLIRPNRALRHVLIPVAELDRFLREGQQ